MSDRPVVLAYDGSDYAERAIAEAAELLGPRSAYVVTIFSPLASQTPFAGGMPVYVPEVEENLEKEAQASAERGAELARKNGFDAKPLSSSNTPAWRGITETAEEVDAAVIVVGARGLSGFKSALLGSTSNGVVHHTRRPVLVMGSGGTSDES